MKRIMSILLCAMMCLGLMAGCAGGGEGEQQAAANTFSVG